MYPLTSLTQSAKSPFPAGYRIPDVHIAASRLGDSAGFCPVRRLESFVTVFVIIPSKYKTVWQIFNIMIKCAVCTCQFNSISANVTVFCPGFDHQLWIYMVEVKLFTATSILKGGFSYQQEWPSNPLSQSWWCPVVRTSTLWHDAISKTDCRGGLKHFIRWRLIMSVSWVAKVFYLSIVNIWGFLRMSLCNQII